MGFFDEGDRLAKLTKLNDPLVSLKSHIDFEIFRPLLEQATRKQRQSPAGRKAYDAVMMFKILVIQRLYNLSDEQAEFQINDRYTFQRFLGLHLGQSVPDFSTVWLFREALSMADAIKPLFDHYADLLQKRGLITNTGTIVDASFVEVPRQRNTREENALVKSGETPAQWNDAPRKLCQKDVDARWAKKNEQSFYGFKNHIRADAESKLITDYVVTDASVHDSQALPELIGSDQVGENLYADSAYKGTESDARLAEIGVNNHIHEKAARNHPLTETQLESNHRKSKVRCRIEHIFGCVENSMGGPELEYIGMRRNQAGIGLSNLVYNFLRYVQLIKMGWAPAGA